jgi:hypothetical protein
VTVRVRGAGSGEPRTLGGEKPAAPWGASPQPLECRIYPNKNWIETNSSNPYWSDAGSASSPASFWDQVTVKRASSAAAGVTVRDGLDYMPPAQETLAYEQDGNLTADGQWTYIWDGEGRLIEMTSLPASVLKPGTTSIQPAVKGQRLVFNYDAKV